MCSEPSCTVYLGFGLTGMTKVERESFINHVKNCASCQDSVKTELTDTDGVTQVLELRRRIG